MGAVKPLSSEAIADCVVAYVEPNPHRPGAANAWLVGYGVPVWALVGYLDVVKGDIRRVAKDYDVPVEAVEAAMLYYAQHKTAIDERIAANAA
jgi:uncharacterized protein (DUF433 family)